MKKYLAVFLIVLMAVSVISAAGVVTANKASAAPQNAPVYVYTDAARTSAHPSHGNLKPFSYYLPNTYGSGTLTVADSTFTSSVTGGGNAAVSVYSFFYSNPQTYEDVARKQVVVSIKVTYTASGSGQFNNHFAVRLKDETIRPIDILWQTTPGTISKTETVTFTGLLFKQVFGPPSTYPYSIKVMSGSYVDGEGSASLTATVSQVTFEFV